MAFNFLSAPMRAMGRGFGSAASSGARPFGMNQSTQPQVQPTRLGGNRFGGFGQRQLPANDLPSQGGYGGNYGRQGIGPSQSPVQSKWQRFAGQFGGQMPSSSNLYNMPQSSQPQDSTGLGSMPFARGAFRNQGPFKPQGQQNSLVDPNMFKGGQLMDSATGQPYQPDQSQIDPELLRRVNEMNNRGDMNYMTGGPMQDGSALPGGIGPSFDLSQMTGGNSGIAGGLFNRGFGGFRMM